MQKTVGSENSIALRVAGLALALCMTAGFADAQPKRWSREWPNTDFSRSAIDFKDIKSGGPGKDGIPAIDDPRFVSAALINRETDWMGPDEPVISVAVGPVARAYPVSTLMWHEIVNDEVNGLPLTITYCPLCNSGIVFKRTVGGRVLDFGVSGKLRHSDMVMYDRQAESWWQQFLGQAIAGEMLGTELETYPARMESFTRFLDRHPDGEVLVPREPGKRGYGSNPYRRYDSSRKPFLYDGRYEGPVPALSRVVAVGQEAWALDLVRTQGRIEAGDLIIPWAPGQNSPLDKAVIREGRDIGNVVLQRRGADGTLSDAAYDIPFAFAFLAFRPDGIIHAKSGS